MAKNGNGNGHGAKLEIPVKLGGVNVGDRVASVGASCPRNQLGVALADQFVCCKRLRVTLMTCASGRADDDPRQGTLGGMDGVFAEIEEMTADTGKVGSDDKRVSFGMAFSIDELGDDGLLALAKFSKRDAMLKIHSAEPLPEKEKKPKAKHTDHDDVGPRPIEGQGALPLGQDQGAVMPVSVLVKFGLTESQCDNLAAGMQLKGVGLTIGELEGWIAKSEYWHRDIKHFGPQTIDKLTGAIAEFRNRYPRPSAEDADRHERYQGAYKMGCEARIYDEDRKSKTQNPHPEKSPENEGWAAGYTATANEPTAPQENVPDGPDGPAGAAARNRAKAAKPNTAFDVKESKGETKAK